MKDSSALIAAARRLPAPLNALVHAGGIKNSAGPAAQHAIEHSARSQTRRSPCLRMQIFRCSQPAAPRRRSAYPRISQLRGLDARWGRAEGYFCPYSCIISIFFEGDNVPHRWEATTLAGCIAIRQREAITPFDPALPSGYHPAIARVPKRFFATLTFARNVGGKK